MLLVILPTVCATTVSSNRSRLYQTRGPRPLATRCWDFVRLRGQGSSSDSQAHSANTPAVHQSVSPTRSGLRLVTFLLRPLPALHGAGQMVSQYHTDTKIRSTNSPVWQLGSFRPTTEEYLPQSSLYHHNFIDCFLARDESPFRKGSIKHSLYRSGDSYLQ